MTGLDACAVCGQPDDNLSSLGRCLSCVAAASDAHATAVRTTRPADTIRRCHGRYFHAPAHTAGCPDYVAPALSADVVSATRSGSPQARLVGILATLHGATEGERNATLHWCACRVGDMLAEGQLPSPRRAGEALAEVAIAIGLEGDLDRGEIGGTIGSGFRTAGVSV